MDKDLKIKVSGDEKKKKESLEGMITSSIEKDGGRALAPTTLQAVVEEAETQKQASGAARRPSRVRKSTVYGLMISAALIATSLLVLTFSVFIPQRTQKKYENAVNLLNDGNYSQAAEKLEALKYKDSKERYYVAKAGMAFDGGDFVGGVQEMSNAGGTVKVFYDANGGACDVTDETITAESEITHTPVKEYYTFTGWTMDGFTIDEEGESYTCNINLKAEYQATEYTVEYHLGGGVNNPENQTVYDVSKGVVTLKEPTKTGYAFDGWYDGQNTVKEYKVQNLTENLSLTAKWTAKEYTVNLNPNTGDYAGEKTITVTYDSELVLGQPTKLGATFEGWYYNNEKLGSTWTIDVSGAVTLTAKWSMISYALTYDLDGGTNDSKNPSSLTYEDSVVIVSPTKEGHTFLGWEINGASESLIEPRLANVLTDTVLVATWSINTYVITLDYTDGNTDSTTVECTYSHSPILPTPSRLGYEFRGWFDGETEIISSWEMPARDLTLTAKWQNACLKYLEYSFSYGDVIIDSIASGFNNEGLIIPETLSGKTVVAIGDRAFHKLSTVKYVELPSTVTSIGSYAFAEMPDLEKVVLTDSVVKMGEYAFYKDTALTSFTVPKNIISSSMGRSILRGCSSLKEITMELTDNYDFGSFFASIPSYVQDNGGIPDSLTTVIITKGSVIPYKFFSYLPATVTDIQFREPIVEVGQYGFAYAETFILPSTIKKIGKEAYSCIGNIGDSLTLHEGLQEIGEWAFGSTYFKEVNLPSSLTKIGRAAFGGINSDNSVLKTVNFNGTKEKWLSISGQDGYDAWSYGLKYGYKVYCTDAYYTSSLYSSEAGWRDIYD